MSPTVISARTCPTIPTLSRRLTANPSSSPAACTPTGWPPSTKPCPTRCRESCTELRSLKFMISGHQPGTKHTLAHVFCLHEPTNTNTHSCCEACCSYIPNDSNVFPADPHTVHKLFFYSHLPDCPTQSTTNHESLSGIRERKCPVTELWLQSACLEE